MNYNDISALGTVEAFKAVTAASTGVVKFGDGTTTGIAGASAELNGLTFGASNDAKLFYSGLANSMILSHVAEHMTFAVIGYEAKNAQIQLAADQWDDAGDAWNISVEQSNQTLNIGNDIASKQTFVSQMTLEPNATLANSVVKVYGVLSASSLTPGGVDLHDDKRIRFGNSQDWELAYTTPGGLQLTAPSGNPGGPNNNESFTIMGNADHTEGPSFRLTNKNSGSEGAEIVFNKESASEADDDSLGKITWQGYDAGNNATRYADIIGLSSDITEGKESGAIKLRCMFSKSVADGGGGPYNATMLTLGNADVNASIIPSVVVNPEELIVDFRVASQDESHMIYVDADNNRVSIGDSTDLPAATFEVTNHATAGAFGVPLLQLNSNDTDKIAVDINAANIDANVLDITADAVTTAAVIVISADALTTGKIVDIESTNNSFNGNLIHAKYAGNSTSAISMAKLWKSSNNGSDSNAIIGLEIDFDMSNGTAGRALKIDSEQTTGVIAEINGDALTTGKAIDISVDALTTGNALYIDDNSANTGTRNVVSIIQNNVAAIAATALAVQSDGGITGMSIVKGFDEAASTARTVTGLDINLDKTGNSTGDNSIFGIRVDVDNTTATNGTNIMRGLYVTPTLQHASVAGTATVEGGRFEAQGHANGTSTATGLAVVAGGADTNYHLLLEAPADAADFASISVGTSGATTIATVDGGAAVAHLTIEADGNIEMTTVAAGTMSLTTNTATAPGGGFDLNSPISSYVSEVNGEIVTTILIDLGVGDIHSQGSNKIIGEDGVSDAYVTRITDAINGVVYKGEISCIEVPVQGDPDINVKVKSTSEPAGTTGTDHELLNAGTWTLGATGVFTFPSGGITDDYLYLVQGGSVDNVYTAGKFIIKLYGANF